MSIRLPAQALVALWTVLMAAYAQDHRIPPQTIKLRINREFEKQVKACLVSELKEVAVEERNSSFYYLEVIVLNAPKSFFYSALFAERLALWPGLAETAVPEKRLREGIDDAVRIRYHETGIRETAKEICDSVATRFKVSVLLPDAQSLLKRRQRPAEGRK